ncbi:MAG: DNA polymerase III subunit alpha, partial [Clostridia bacterium]|nr:DNA polymerase III subunit alpha [Clostridia bacterium]
MDPFVHLHLHTEYSLLDGAARIDRLFQVAKEKNIPAVAMTDHGNMYGGIAFSKAAKEHGIKPIIGCEFYVTKDYKSRDSKRNEMYHLVLLAKNTQGYKNIIKLDSIAFIDGFYYKPRIDMDLLEKHTEGVVCLSACLAGELQRLLLSDRDEEARALCERFIRMFGEDFYIELQDHGIPEQKYVNPKLIALARELGVKMVATNDVHYINKSDAEMHDVLLCVQTGKHIDDEDRMRFSTQEFYLKDHDEMAALFPEVPDAITNTLEVAEKCNFEFAYHQPLLPNYVPADGTTPKQFLRKLCMDGLNNRYKVITPEIMERAEYELGIIDRMGFNEYYLIVWDFINYARMHDIPVGAGRGSGVGSIVAYAVGITNVEPLQYALLFERFLNPERQSMPDFDVDFCGERRGEVIEYVKEKYGDGKVCQIVTFGTMAAKNAIKDVARVYRVPYADVDKITKAMPGKGTIPQLFGFVEPKPGKPDISVPELKEMYANDATVRQIVDMARQLEGMPRNTSKHAAGVVICKDVISDHVPMQRNGEDITTQYNMIEVEELGLLKMDFLGLKTLTDIKKAVTYVKEEHGITVDFAEIGYEDRGTYELIGEGDTDAVFQLESAGMKKFMRDLRPNNLEDIIA